MRGPRKREKNELVGKKIDTYSNLKSIDEGKRVLKHYSSFVYGKKSKNPANAQNWHQHQQPLDSSSGRKRELEMINFDLLLLIKIPKNLGTRKVWGTKKALL